MLGEWSNRLCGGQTVCTQGFIYSSSADVREIAAHLLGILSSRYGTEPSLLQAKEFLQDTFSEVTMVMVWI